MKAMSLLGVALLCSCGIAKNQESSSVKEDVAETSSILNLSGHEKSGNLVFNQPVTVTLAGMTEHVYAIQLDTQANVTLETSGSLDTYLTLKDQAGSVLAQDDDSGDGSNARIQMNLGTGYYLVFVRGYSSSVNGDITLTATSPDVAQPLQPNKPTPVLLNGTTDRVFSFSSRLGGSVTILTQGGLDTYLSLFDEAGSNLASDDDGGEGSNACIIRELAPGRYTIRLRGYSDSVVGETTLLLSSAGIPSDIRIGEPTPLVIAGDANLAFSFRLRTSAEVTIQTVGGLDTYLTLKDANGNVLATDDDGGDGSNACIIRQLEAGEYVVLVRGYSSSVSGDSTLLVQSSAGGDPIPLQLGIPRDGVISAGISQIYSLYIPYEARYTITTTGSTDTYMTLRNANGVLAQDDDSGDGSNACVIISLPAGEVLIEVRGYSGSTTGPYGLLATQ